MTRLHDYVPNDPIARMRLAIEEALLAEKKCEVPVGAAVFHADGRLLGLGHDLRMETHDPTAHAEILAMRQAAEQLGDWRLDGCELYVTLEPCPMCAGALILARIGKVVFGALSRKAGAVVSHTRLLDIQTFNHRVEAEGGILADECSLILTRYFQAHRADKKPGSDPFEDA